MHNFKTALYYTGLVTIALATMGIGIGGAHAKAGKATAHAAAKAPAKKAAKQVAPHPYDANLAGKTSIYEVYQDCEDSCETSILSFDQNLLIQDPNASVNSLAVYDNGNDGEEDQKRFENAFTDAIAKGQQTIVFIQTDRAREVRHYLSATPRSVSFLQSSSYASDPRYQQLQNQYKQEQENMRIAGNKAEAAGQRATSQAASDPFGGLMTALVNASNDYGYGDAKRRAESIQSQMASMQQPTRVYVSTADVKRELMFDGQMALYFCEVKTRLCGSTTRDVSAAANVNAPLAIFSAEPDYATKNTMYQPWFDYIADVKKKSAFGFTLAQLNNAGNGIMLDIPAGKLASRISADKKTFMNNVKAKQDSNKALSETVVAQLVPIATALPKTKTLMKPDNQQFEDQLILAESKRIAAAKAEADRIKNLQGL